MPHDSSRPTTQIPAFLEADPLQDNQVKSKREGPASCRPHPPSPPLTPPFWVHISGYGWRRALGEMDVCAVQRPIRRMGRQPHESLDSIQRVGGSSPSWRTNSEVRALQGTGAIATGAGSPDVNGSVLMRVPTPRTRFSGVAAGANQATYLSLTAHLDAAGELLTRRGGARRLCAMS